MKAGVYMDLYLEFDEFLRSIKQNRNVAHSVLLGAGASIESGIHSAHDCIWEWKKEIFISNNPTQTDLCKNIKMDSVQKIIQRWLDNQGGYPQNGSNEEYSFYAEKAYKIPGDRQRFFLSLIENKKPSIGYHILAILAEMNTVKTIWTTNFDGFMVKTAHQYSVVPIEITLESQDRIFRPHSDKELLCVALHGDYKYGPLKNTTDELDNQSEIFSRALDIHFNTENVIVIGYSGRDKSLMKEIQKAYTQKGSGRLYWCGYGNHIDKEVETLISEIRKTGREAYFVPTDGFDKTMLSMISVAFNDSDHVKNSLINIKKSFVLSSQFENVKFKSPNIAVNKVIKSNLFPIVFPKSCYQFSVRVNEKESYWDLTKGLLDFGVIAVPYKGLIYAWGDKDNIVSYCSYKLTSPIELISFPKENLIMFPIFREMVLRAIVILVAKKMNYGSNMKNKIWNTQKCSNYVVENKKIAAFDGLKLSIQSDWNHIYLSISPQIIYPQNMELSKSERKAIADIFHKKVNKDKPNFYFHNYIFDYFNEISGDKFVELTTNETVKDFVFKISKNALHIGLSDNSKSKAVHPDITEKQIALKGIELRDPELQFYDPVRKKFSNDFHPMRGLTQYQPFDYFLNDSGYISKNITLGIITPFAYKNKVSDFLSGLNFDVNTAVNIDYIIKYPGFNQAYGTGINIPEKESDRWNDYQIGNKSIKEEAKKLAENLVRKIDNLNAQGDSDIIIIFVPKEYESFTQYEDENESFDLHNYIKAYAVQKNISTQFLREKTIDSDLKCQIMWSLSLAFYVKAKRTPWIISGLKNDTAFAGIGYSVNKSTKKEHILVGCSHLYSSEGIGLKYKLSKITDFSLDKRDNPFLSESEAFKLGLSINSLFYESFSELPKRVVIHKRTPFKHDEIKGITDSLHSVGVMDIDLIEINYEDNAKFFEYNSKNFIIDGFPVRRGCCFPVNDNTAYIYTHGIAPSVRNPNFKFIKGGKSIPLPLKIVKHYGTGDLSQIATEILGLTKMNWNSFELYSKLPCTIDSSNEIAKIGWMLSQYEGVVYDYRNFM